MTTLLKPARGRGRRASAQGVLARCLLMLNRLKQGPARKAELIEAVRRDLPGAYPAASSGSRSHTQTVSMRYLSLGRSSACRSRRRRWRG